MTARRRYGAIARTYEQRTDRRAPSHARTPGVALFRLWTAAQEDHGQYLRCVGAMNASDRQNAKLTNHALAPARPARHSAQPVMPIGLGVVAWRRCGANARTYGCRNTGVPRHGRTPGAALFRPRIAGQTALRTVLAVRRHGERAGSSKRKPHPSRDSPGTDRLDALTRCLC